MKFVRKLPDVEELQKEYSLSDKQIEARNKFINEIKDILAGVDARKILIVGPCSADREDAVIEYTLRLADVS